MTDPRKERTEQVKPAQSPQEGEADREHRARTEGTNRDFDASGESDNQGHGHPREERGRTTD